MSRGVGVLQDLDDGFETGVDDRPPGFGPLLVHRAFGQPSLDPLSRRLQKLRITAQPLGDLAMTCKAALDFRSYDWWIHDFLIIQSGRVESDPFYAPAPHHSGTVSQPGNGSWVSVHPVGGVLVDDCVGSEMNGRRESREDRGRGDTPSFGVSSVRRPRA